MTDIVAFLTARLDEKQAGAEAAQAVDPGPWTVQPVSPKYPYKAAEAGNCSGHGAAVVVAADGTELWDTYDSDYGHDQHSMAAPTARHVARHDPTRVLADIAAKRAILEIHAPEDVESGDDGRLGTVCGNCDYEAWPCQTVILLALPDADHPDYDESWRP